MNRFVATVGTVGNGVTRKVNAINGKDDDRWNLEQWYRTRQQRVQAVNSSLVRPACWSTTAADVDEEWPEEWCSDWERTGWKTGMMTGLGPIQRNNRVNGTMMRVRSYLVCGVAGSKSKSETAVCQDFRAIANLACTSRFLISLQPL